MASSVDHQAQSAPQSHLPHQTHHRALRSKIDEPGSNAQIQQGNSSVPSTTPMEISSDLNNASSEMSAPFYFYSHSYAEGPFKHTAQLPLRQASQFEPERSKQLTDYREGEAIREQLFQQAAAAVAQGDQSQQQTRQSQHPPQPQHQQPMAPKPSDTMGGAGNGAGVAQHPQSQKHQSQQTQQPAPSQLQQQPQGQSPNNPDTPIQQQVTRIDPAIEGPYGSVPVPTTPGQGSNGPDGSMIDPVSPDSSNLSKRELSQSKRAAQNRAAQRAFRQRKETYIKKLEEQVRDATVYPPLQQDHSRLQNENFQLRDYIIALQLRLLETAGGYPPPPQGVELRDPKNDDPTQQQHQGMAAPTATMGSTPVAHLQAAAAAAAQSGNYDGKGGPGEEQFGGHDYPPRTLPNTAGNQPGGPEAPQKPGGE